MFILQRNDYPGFSLIELLIIIAITAVMLVVAVPSFISYLQLNRLRGTVQQQYYSLQYARSEAVKRNSNVYVTFQTGDSWCYGMNVGSVCNCSTPSGCGLGVVKAPKAQQLTLSTSGILASTIQFEPTHGAANASGLITFTLYGQTTSMSVKMGRLGNVIICSSSITGYQSCS